MNKIEKHNMLRKEIGDLIEKKEFNEKMISLFEEIREIEKHYTVEDLITELGTIGCKVNIEKLTKHLHEKKKQYEANGDKFTEETIGEILLMSFGKFYRDHQRRGK